MPASPMGLRNLFIERNSTMQGYQLVGCAPSPQLTSHINTNGQPLSYSGLYSGYNFIPYPQTRHMMSSFDLKAASPYHHTLLNRGALYLPYRAMGQDDPSRTNKVASRESTSALKAWLNEHLKNPYPTKGEKIMLAIVSKMSLTQVSTWFANARRRLKKENRVSWASKGKCDEEDEGESEEEGVTQKATTPVSEDEDEEIDPGAVDEEEQCRESESECPSHPVNGFFPQSVEQAKEKENSDDDLVKGEQGPSELNKENKEGHSIQKPKIWSLAEIATSQTTHSPSSNNNSGLDVGKWWLDWASRNGVYFPANSDFLKQNSGHEVHF